MRLIDADGFIGFLKELAEDGTENIKISEVIYVLNHIPTRLGIPFDAPTDTVEVVRCRECKYSDKDTGNLVYCTEYQTGKVIDGFCNLGKRRDD